MSFKQYLNYFEFDTTLPGSGDRLKIRPITTGMLKRLLLYENATEEQGIIEDALDDLLGQCVISKDFKIENQYLQDRFFLLAELRKITKGNLYTFQAVCPKCNSQSSQTIDLTKLKLTKNPLLTEKVNPVAERIQEQSKPKPKPGLHVKKVEKVPEVKETELKETLQVSPYIVKVNENIAVELSFITRGMQKNAFVITNAMKNMKDNQRRAESMIVITASAIKAVITPDGREEPSLEDKVYLLNNTSQAEMEKINEWYEKNDFGLDFSFDTKCPHCNEESRREIPVESFFY
jgi:hypothetical protein